MSIVFYLERTNQLSLLPDKDLVDLCPPIEPYQVTKNQFSYQSPTTQDNARSLKTVDQKLWLRTTALNYQFNGEGGI
ncbi:MAG: hypothetical protein O9332_13155 [Microcystis sp. LE19-10.1B]|uniref:hypothetical protein n=1 Tax=Microcystis sp. LE19-10.1B TaxID=3016428 RepID=UPI0008FFD101|nr:hypothetical protein [Microcystis sp. LE19-10.1B]MCZ8026323.1 hypothetical protein [Microcystis sp. LE19-10.1B]